MKHFQDERLNGEEGAYHEMINCAFTKGSVAIDLDKRAEQEYYDCCKPSVAGINLQDWISDQLITGKFIYCIHDDSAKRKLREMGVPAKDLKWPAIAIGSGADLIITNDIDLFDPAAKNYTSKKKDQIKRDGGPVSKYLRKNHSIEVSKAEHFIST
ncbi:hypothetical protein [Rhodobacter sp. 24-YEA-8]|uniref:hypothetical protein n=1 Tax=Rhodobacter sp. 24-YEA-8 TaxID=1884310 RepID=UPI00115FF6EC|nr:hypothetical protein [Rhodobacter sp. 24-YEA-8]